MSRVNSNLCNTCLMALKKDFLSVENSRKCLLITNICLSILLIASTIVMLLAFPFATSHIIASSAMLITSVTLIALSICILFKKCIFAIPKRKDSHEAAAAKDLNDQLVQAKNQIKDLEAQLLEKHTEISEKEMERCGLSSLKTAENNVFTSLTDISAQLTTGMNQMSALQQQLSLTSVQLDRASTKMIVEARKVVNANEEKLGKNHNHS